MLHCIIVEDERLAREKLKLYITKHELLQLSAEFATASSFMHQFNDLACDLVFLDIALPDIDGIAIAEMIKDKCLIVFTTAYSEYAVEGFRLNAIDYLLKPFDYPRFCEAVRRTHPLPQYNSEESIIIKDGKKTYQLNINDLLYIKSLREYVSWHTEKTKIVSLHSLSGIVDYLGTKGFVQVHRSYIVNIKKVSALVGNGLEIQGIHIPIGKTYKRSVARLFESSI